MATQREPTPRTPELLAPVERIVVAMDASAYSRAILQTAARLARALGVPLHGIYVEDVRLLDCVALPFVQEVTLSGNVRPVTPEVLAHEMALLARRIRDWMEEIAASLEVTWSFQTLRGQVVEALLSLVGPQDLLSLGRYGMPVSPRPTRMGSVAQAVLESYPGPLLLLHRELRAGDWIVAVLSHPEDQGTLELAERLADIFQGTLAVIALEAQAAEAARHRLASRRVPVRMAASLETLHQALYELAPGGNGLLVSRVCPEIVREEEWGILCIP